MNKKYLLGGIAALLLGAYVFWVLNATVQTSGGMGNMVMDGSSTMTMNTTAGGAAEGFQTAMNVMMEGIMRPATGYPDVDFAKMMISHHEGAVAMAQVEKQFGKDQFLLNLADGIITSQGAEIVFLKDWLGKQDLSAMQVIPEANKANYASMMSMMKGMEIGFTGNADVDFAKSMIPHHQGAVEMAKVVLQFGKDAEIRKLAENIVSTQQAEISSLKDWLAKAAP